MHGGWRLLRNARTALIIISPEVEQQNYVPIICDKQLSPVLQGLKEIPVILFSFQIEARKTVGFYFLK